MGDFDIINKGLIIDVNYSELACSPDGFVIDIETEEIVGLLEIKCPSETKNFTLEEIENDSQI